MTGGGGASCKGQERRLWAAAAHRRRQRSGGVEKGSQRHSGCLVAIYLAVPHLTIVSHSCYRPEAAPGSEKMRSSLLLALLLTALASTGYAAYGKPRSWRLRPATTSLATTRRRHPPPPSLLLSPCPAVCPAAQCQPPSCFCASAQSPLPASSGKPPQFVVLVRRAAGTRWRFGVPWGHF